MRPSRMSLPRDTVKRTRSCCASTAERIAALGIALAEYPLLSAQGGYARHDPELLARAVMELYRERTVRIYRGTQQYITEEQEWK